MDKGNVDKHRRTMSGLRAQETMKWGADKARSRYGALDYQNSPPPQPKDQSRPQKLGDSGNLQDRGYDNNAAKDWRLGFGKNGSESAEGYPGFVPNKGGKR
jgi:hypothetical protein